jgi:hypothetical protein
MKNAGPHSEHIFNQIGIFVSIISLDHDDHVGNFLFKVVFSAAIISTQNVPN